MFINSSSNLRYDNFAIVHYSLNMILLYAVMAVIGIVGNVVTCIVIANNKSMNTATNYYLFNLAISDLMILIWGPPIFNAVSYGSEFICKSRALIAKTSLNVAISIVCVLSVERYVAICHPFLASKHHVSSISRAKKVIPVIWLVGILGAVPLSLQYGLVHHLQDPEMVGCRPISKLITYLEGIRSLFIFVAPMLVICTMYALLGLRLRKSAGIQSNNNESSDRLRQRVPKMLLTLVVVFTVCQMPLHVIRMLRIYNNLYKSLTRLIDRTTWSYVTDLSHVMYFMSSLINPIIYNISSKKFREAFKDTLLKCFKIQGSSDDSCSDMNSRQMNHCGKISVMSTI